jgi:hypothetical protein
VPLAAPGRSGGQLMQVLFASGKTDAHTCTYIHPFLINFHQFINFSLARRDDLFNFIVVANATACLFENLFLEQRPLDGIPLL